MNRKKFRCNPRSYKLTRPPKEFLINRIKKSILQKGIQSGLLLDIGCGNGGYISRLSKDMNLSFVGIDSSMKMLEQATAQKASTLLINSSFSDGLPLADNIFNVVISVDSIHFCENLSGLFQEISRILAPGGLLIVCTHTEDDLKRQTLGVFFPKTIAIEAAAAKRLRNICNIARRFGLRNYSRKIDIVKFSPNNNYINLFSTKCASVLHSIPSFYFYRGLSRLKCMAATKRRVAVESYTTFFFQKPAL